MSLIAKYNGNMNVIGDLLKEYRTMCLIPKLKFLL